MPKCYNHAPAGVPPIIPTSASNDIKLKVFGDKFVPKNPAGLKELDGNGKLSAKDYVYLTDEEGNLRKIKAVNLAGKTGLMFNKMYKTTNIVDGAELTLSTKDFNRQPESTEVFNLYAYDNLNYNIWIAMCVVTCAGPRTVHAKISGDPIYLGKGSNAFEFSKIKDYLYNIEYHIIDYDYTLKNDQLINKIIKDAEFGYGLTVRKGNLFGRTYTNYYDDKVEFIIHTDGGVDRHQSVGICGNLKTFTNDFVDSRQDSEFYKSLPLLTTDGVNDSRLAVSIEFMPKKPTTKSNDIIWAKTEERYKVPAFMLVRVLLDKCSTAREAINYLKNYITITHLNTYDVHYLISDRTESYVVEFIDNEIKDMFYTLDEITILSGFKLTDTSSYYGWLYDSNHRLVSADATPGTIEEAKSRNLYVKTGFSGILDELYYPLAETTMTQEEYSAIINRTDGHYGIAKYNNANINKLVDNSAGIERYNNILNNLDSMTVPESFVHAIADNLKGTKLYSSTWLSDALYFDDSKTILDDVSTLSDVIITEKSKFDHRTRHRSNEFFGSIQTVHTSMYDLNDSKLYIVGQEGDNLEEYNTDDYLTFATTAATYTRFEIDQMVEHLQEQIDEQVDEMNKFVYNKTENHYEDFSTVTMEYENVNDFTFYDDDVLEDVEFPEKPDEPQSPGGIEITVGEDD